MHLCCIFLNLSIMSFPKFVNMTKNTPPVFPILHVFAPLNDVHVYFAWSWKTTLITWFFLPGWYPTSNTSGPPGFFVYRKPQAVEILAKQWKTKEFFFAFWLYQFTVWLFGIIHTTWRRKPHEFFLVPGIRAVQ